MRRFHDDNHANNRLARCYAMCLIDGEWVSRRIEHATKRTITVNCGTEFAMDDEANIKFLFPRLGYVNTRHQCVYVTRSSRRLWKVGIVPDNLKMDMIFPEHIRRVDVISGNDAVAFLFKGKYPSAIAALNKVSNGEAAACAFHRHFCFGLHSKTKEIILYYQNMPLGHYDKGEDSIIIGDVNSHLVQPFKEASKDVFKVLV